MSAFNDPRYLVASGAIKGLPVFVDHDRPCPGCNYNLRGLEVGGVCPECGRAIAPALGKGISDTLIDAPRAYLREFAVALTCAFLGLAAVVLGLFTVLTLAVVNATFAFYGQQGRNGISGPQLRIPTPSDTFFAAIFLLGAILWMGGLIGATRPRPTPAGAPDPRSREWKRLRSATWCTQAGWIIASGMVFLLAFMAPAPLPGTTPAGWIAPVAVLALVGGFTGLVGFIGVACLLARYADWIPDTELAWRLRTSAWMIGVFGGLLALTGVTPISLPSFAGLLPFILWLSVSGIWFGFLAGLGVLFIAIAQMAMTAWNAVANHNERAARDTRMLERMRKEREEQDRRAALIPYREEPAPGVRKIGVAPTKPPTRPPSARG